MTAPPGPICAELAAATSAAMRSPVASGIDKGSIFRRSILGGGTSTTRTPSRQLSVRERKKEVGWLLTCSTYVSNSNEATEAARAVTCTAPAA